MPFEITKAVIVATTITTTPQVEERQGIVVHQPQVRYERPIQSDPFKIIRDFAKPCIPIHHSMRTPGSPEC